MTPIIIGRAERIDFPEQMLSAVPARIDTGAKTSSIWATAIKENDGVLSFKLFGKKSKYYNPKNVIKTKSYTTTMVSSSTGELQIRYVVKLLINISGKRIRASFTLANRSTQVYPVLIGRNVLRSKFIVDVKQGRPLVARERERARELKLAREKRRMGK